jgi:hypothetical protein
MIVFLNTNHKPIIFLNTNHEPVCTLYQYSRKNWCNHLMFRTQKKTPSAPLFFNSQRERDQLIWVRGRSTHDSCVCNNDHIWMQISRLYQYTTVRDQFRENTHPTDIQLWHPLQKGNHKQTALKSLTHHPWVKSSIPSLGVKSTIQQPLRIEGD